MKKLIYLITFLASISASAQYIDASNTTVVGLTEKNTDSIMSLDGEGKMGYTLKSDIAESIIVEDITALEAYDGEATTLIVKDSLRGGIFNYVASGLTTDNGVVFDANNGGHWARQYNQADGLNVLWYGADQTGVEDNSDIIEYLIFEKGGNIYFPKGLYSINRTIGDANETVSSIILEKNLSLIGDNATFIANPSGVIHSLFAVETKGISVKIEGLNIDGNNKANRGYYFRNTNEFPSAISFKNFTIKKVTNNTEIPGNFRGISLYDNFGKVDINNVVIDSIYSAVGGGYPIVIGGFDFRPQNVRITKTIIKDIEVTVGVITGIYIQQSDNIDIEDVLLDNIQSTGTSRGIELSDVKNANITRSSLYNLSSTGNLFAIQFENSIDFTCYNNTIDNVNSTVSRGIQANGGNLKTGSILFNNISNISSVNDADGIYINSTNFTDIDISHNFIYNCSKRYLKIDAEGVDISNNILKSEDFSETMQSIISIFKNNVTFKNNKILSDNPVYRGVRINTNKNIHISNNEFTFNPTSSLFYQESPNLIENITIKNNIFNYDSDANFTNGIWIDGDSKNVKIENNQFNNDLYNSVIRLGGYADNLYVTNNSYDFTLTSGFPYMVSTVNSENNYIVAFHNNYNSAQNELVIEPQVDGVTIELNNIINGTLKPELGTMSAEDAADYYTQTQVNDTLSNYTLSSLLSTVATSGDYDDLTNTPTIPEQVNLQEGANITITGTYPNLTLSASGDIGGSVEWGSITGTLSSQNDLQSALDDKYDASNPDGFTTNIGTVTSVGLQVPEGFEVSNSPITSSGAFEIDYAEGYQPYTTEEADKLASIEEGAEVNVNADWNASSGDAEILNKPTIPAQVNLIEGSNIDITGTYPNLTISATGGGGSVTWEEITGDQSGINLSGFTNDLGCNCSWEDIGDRPTDLEDFNNDGIDPYIPESHVIGEPSGEGEIRIPVYEEGTYAATILGDSGSFSAGNQNYIRVGNQVTVYISISAFEPIGAGVSGSIQLSLPNFGMAVAEGASASVVHGDNVRYPTDAVSLLFLTGETDRFVFVSDEGGTSDLQATDITGSVDLQLTLTYRIE